MHEVKTTPAGALHHTKCTSVGYGLEHFAWGTWMVDDVMHFAGGLQ